MMLADPSEVFPFIKLNLCSSFIHFLSDEFISYLNIFCMII